MADGQFIPLNDLEAQLIAAGAGDDAARTAFERNLPDALLFVATPKPLPEGERTVSAGETMSLLSVQLNDGRRATALFTAQERIAPFFGDGVGYVGIQARTLFEMIRADPAILNPGQPYGVLWEPANLANMAGLPAERTIAKDTQVMLGSPSDHPIELLNRLRQAFEPLEEAQAAWLALAYWPEEKTQGWYLDVRCDGDHERIRRALATVMAGLDLGGRPLDMIVQPTSKEDGIGLKVLSRHVPPPSKSKGKGIFGRLFR